eukprot:PITA_28040
MVNIKVKSCETVLPAAPTPRGNVWLSNLDLVVGRTHASTVYIYRPTGTATPHFFSMNILKDALSKVLVPFYPIAGRLGKDAHGRLQINCNGEGGELIEAVTDSTIDDFGDFAPSPELCQLLPRLDCTAEDIHTYPLLLVQVTFFKCGGVSLGVRINHIVGDGFAGLHFMNSWAAVARGADITQPFLDRSIFQADNIARPKFHHIEYEQPSPLTEKNGAMNDNQNSIGIFKITKHQLDSLKAKATENGNQVKYSSYEMLSGHIWRCVCKAGNLREDEESKMYVPIDSRNRLVPPLPPNYFGNAIFIASPMALVGDLISKPLYYAASIIHEGLVRMDDEYLRSALNYLDSQHDLNALVRGSHTYRSPHLCITSWSRLPIHDADFGWGKPIYMGPAIIAFENSICILSSPVNDGSLTVAIKLQKDQMNGFKNLFYDF